MYTEPDLEQTVIRVVPKDSTSPFRNPFGESALNVLGPQCSSHSRGTMPPVERLSGRRAGTTFVLLSTSTVPLGRYLPKWANVSSDTAWVLFLYTNTRALSRGVAGVFAIISWVYEKSYAARDWGGLIAWILPIWYTNARRSHRKGNLMLPSGMLSEPTNASFEDVLTKTIDVVGAIAPEHRRGGFACFRTDESGSNIYTTAHGSIPPTLEHIYKQNAYEKIIRLSYHEGDISSFQSRNPAEGRWGGAIRLKGIVLSFSGLTELLDEAYLLSIAIQCGWCSPLRAKRVIQKSNNHWFERTWHLIHKASS